MMPSSVGRAFNVLECGGHLERGGLSIKTIYYIIIKCLIVKKKIVRVKLWWILFFIKLLFSLMLNNN